MPSAFHLQSQNLEVIPPEQTLEIPPEKYSLTRDQAEKTRKRYIKWQAMTRLTHCLSRLIAACS